MTNALLDSFVLFILCLFACFVCLIICFLVCLIHLLGWMLIITFCFTIIAGIVRHGIKACKTCHMTGKQSELFPVKQFVT